MRERPGRAGLAAMRERAERTLAEYRTRTRAIAARLSTGDTTEQVAELDGAELDGAEMDGAEMDNDVVASWMADPRGGAERRSPTGAAVDRIERGETTWDDVLSGRATDRDSVALRAFLRDRVAEIRAERQARR